MHARLSMTFALAVLSGVASAETRWQRVSADGRKVGHVEMTRTIAPNGDVTVTERLEVQLGAAARRVTYRSSTGIESGPDGRLLRYSRETETAEGHSRVQAAVIQGDLVVTNGVDERRQVTVLEGVAIGLESPEYARPWLAAVARGELVPPLLFRTWDPAKIAVIDVELRRSQAGETNVERRVRTIGGTSVSRQRADTLGNVVYANMSFGAYDFEIEDVSENEARARNEVFDHVTPLLQASPYRIPARDMRQKIRYSFDHGGHEPVIPAGAGQRTWNEGRTTWIQVCASCPLDATPLGDYERAAALGSTDWLQSADPKIARRAATLTPRTGDAAAKMRRLTQFVRGHMGTEIDMLGYGSALEALESRRGDCTEFATLLAALGRAAGIPTRIAIGRVYARQFESARHVFVPHAWVQAWTGAGWESFDAAIGSFDSTHLAFAVSYDGSPVAHYAGVQLSRELRMQTAARVVPRKSAAAD